MSVVVVADAAVQVLAAAVAAVGAAVARIPFRLSMKREIIKTCQVLRGIASVKQEANGSSHLALAAMM